MTQWDIETQNNRVIYDYKKPILSVDQSQYLLFLGTEDSLKILDFNMNIKKSIWFDGKESGNGAIKTISLDSQEKWLFFGGECTYSTLLYLETLAITAILPTSSYTNDSLFDDQIITVGNECNIHFWERNGKLAKRMESTKLTRIVNVAKFGERYIVSGLGRRLAILSKNLITEIEI